MAYTYSTIEAQVRANVNDATAGVSQEIDDAINLLSNFFSLKKVSESIDTVANQNYIDQPTRCLEVLRVIINDVEYSKATPSDLKNADEYDNRTWAQWDDKIKITPTPSSVEDCEIWYRAGFAPLGGTGSTDIPDRLVPLLVILASWLYFLQMMVKVATARENYPDMTPEEAGETAKLLKDQFDSMLATVQSQH